MDGRKQQGTMYASFKGRYVICRIIDFVSLKRKTLFLSFLIVMYFVGIRMNGQLKFRLQKEIALLYCMELLYNFYQNIFKRLDLSQSLSEYRIVRRNTISYVDN